MSDDLGISGHHGRGRRSRGRGRGSRGRGTGSRGRGEEGVLLSPDPSSRTAEEKITKTVKPVRNKEMSRSLLPETPARKRARKECECCRPVLGTPPAPKLKPRHMSAGASTPKLLEATLDPATPTIALKVESVCEPCLSDTTEVPELSCDWTTGQLKYTPISQLSAVRASIPDSTFRRLLEEESESENDDLDADDMTPTLTPADLLAPTNVNDYLEDDIRLWLRDEDRESDRYLQDLLPTEQCLFDWSPDGDSFTGLRETFIGNPGPTFPVTDSTRPIDIFLKIFDDNFFDLLVSQTNRYASRQTDRPLSDHSRLKYFTNVDKDEMASFLAIMILQGCVSFPLEKNYWSENGFFTLKYFKDIMTYNRFVLLKRLFHITDSTDVPNLTKDELRKIQPVLEIFNEKFSSLYLPGQTVYIDESLLKWKGRPSFVWKISSKASRGGLKSYELCDSATGYLWSFYVDAGKRDGQADYSTGGLTVPAGIAARIVNNLTGPLLNRGHTLVMDNFYNSPLLARYLKSKGTDCFGTLRVNRELVPESLQSMLESEMRIGELGQSFTRDLSVSLWRDTNLVSMISTYHAGVVAGKEKCGRYTYKPQAVLDYKLAMGGVEKKDRLLSAFPMDRTRNQVWYNKVFRRLLNYAVINSYIIYKTHSPHAPHRGFRIQLAEELVQAFKGPLKVLTSGFMDTNTNNMRPILSGNHFIGYGKSKRAVCVWCRKSRTRLICKQCDVALCLHICFEEYHTVRDPLQI